MRRTMATIWVRSSHISYGSPPILGFGLGLLGSDQGMRKTKGNLAVGERRAARELGCKETRSGIQYTDARWWGPFLADAV